MGKYFPTVLSIRTPFGVNGHDNTLAAKHFSGFPHKVWPTYGGSIDRDFIGPSPEEVANFVGAVNPSANCQWHKDTLRRAVDHINDDLALFMRGGNVEEDEFISALPVIELGCLYRIAGITQVEEVDALHNPTIFDIKTGNDTFGEHAFALLLHCSTRLLVGETSLV
jgi:hypothetical protein